VNELEEDITWFDVIGDDPEDVRMCREYKEGCIGEEDAPDSEDIEMDSELAASQMDTMSQMLTLFSRQTIGRFEYRESPAHTQDGPRS